MPSLPLWGGPKINSNKSYKIIHSMPCRILRRVFIHEIFFGPLGLPLLVWSKLGWFHFFRPMRALSLKWSWTFNLVCEVAIRWWRSHSFELQKITTMVATASIWIAMKHMFPNLRRSELLGKGYHSRITYLTTQTHLLLRAISERFLSSLVTSNLRHQGPWLGGKDSWPPMRRLWVPFPMPAWCSPS
jgi:hypothetical protein